jgi:hypothetical protein
MPIKNKTKFLIFIVLALIIAGGAVASYLYLFRPQKNSKDVSEATKKQAEQKDVEVAKSSENKNSQPDNVQNSQSPSQASTVAINISSLGVSGQNVYISALVSGTTSGTCKLTMQNGSATVSKQASVGLQVSYYICQGFTVPLSELVPKGEWNAFIELSSPNGNAKSEIKQVTVK